MKKIDIDSTISFPTWPVFAEDEIAMVEKVLQSGKVNYWTGNEGKLFEEEFANFIGTKYSIALMNGTIALEAALYSLGIGEGDEVITTCRTFVASASAVVMRGATPLMADVDSNSQNITAHTIQPLISSRTKAIIVVHLAGWPCDMDPILELAKKHNLYVIEDCAQAHGATYRGEQVGSLGDIAAFSFCQDKIMTTGGEGGMITTNNKSLWEKIWSMKDHGKSYEAVFNQGYRPGFRWLHESFGTNWRMTEIQATIGRIQLLKLKEWVRIRRRNAAIFNDILAKCPALRLTIPNAEIQHSYYKYYTFIQPEFLKKEWTRDRIMQAINAAGVPCFTGSCSEIYQEKAFMNANIQPKKRLKVAKDLGETSLMFQVHPTISEKDARLMGNIVFNVIEQASLRKEKIVV